MPGGWGVRRCGMSADDDRAGYRRPPRHSRFKKGQSGNPKGRPKGSHNFSTDLGKELRSRVRVREDGKEKSVSKQEAVVKSMVAKAANGDPRALGLLIKAVERFEAEPTPPSDVPSSDEAQLIEIFTESIRAQARAEPGEDQSEGNTNDD